MARSRSDRRTSHSHRSAATASSRTSRVNQGIHATNSVYARIVDNIRAKALSTQELAEVTGVGVRQVLYWAAGDHRPRGESRDRLLEVEYIVNQLSEIYTPEGVEIWVHGRNRLLGGTKPIDRLREGDFESVLYAIEQLKSGSM